MSGPLVTVIVPVYKVEQYLPACVESILRQSYWNLQLLLVDDGSPDSCGEICDWYARRDRRVQAVHKPNGGVGSARNAGLELAKGEYVCFVDGDDMITPDMVERALREMEEGSWDLCMWSIQLWENGALRDAGRRRRLEFHFEEEAERADFLCRWFLPSRLGWAACQGMFRRSRLEEPPLRFGRATFAEDMDFVFRYLLRSTSLRILGEPLYRYRARSTSATHTIRLDQQMEQLLRILDRQRADLFQSVPFRNYALCELVLLSRYVEEMGMGLLSERARRMLELLKRCPEWEGLREDAERVAADRGGVQRFCRRPYGNLVSSFSRFLLHEDADRFIRDAWLYQAFIQAKKVKDRLTAFRRREEA